LFRVPVTVYNIHSPQLAASADGQRFLIGSMDRATKEKDEFTLLSSWPSLLSH